MLSFRNPVSDSRADISRDTIFSPIKGTEESARKKKIKNASRDNPHGTKHTPEMIADPNHLPRQRSLYHPDIKTISWITSSAPKFCSELRTTRGNKDEDRFR